MCMGGMGQDWHFEFITINCNAVDDTDHQYCDKMSQISTIVIKYPVFYAFFIVRLQWSKIRYSHELFKSRQTQRIFESLLSCEWQRFFSSFKVFQGWLIWTARHISSVDNKLRCWDRNCRQSVKLYFGIRTIAQQFTGHLIHQKRWYH